MAGWGAWFSSLDKKNLGLLVVFLFSLWTILGLIFWGFINIALSIRERNYFSVPDRWIGDYETHIQFEEAIRVGGLMTVEKSIGYPNIPEGCINEKDQLQLNGAGTVACNNKHWTVPPWIVEAGSNACGSREGRLSDNPSNFDVLETSIYSPSCVMKPGSCDVADICMPLVPVSAFLAAVS